MQVIKPISIFLEFILWIIISISSCHPLTDGEVPEKEEILAVEKEFIEKVKEWGIKDAFVYFADDSAVLVRNNHLIKGKEEIEAYYSKSPMLNIQLAWQPEFVEVAACSDLAYTYGPYTFSAKDSTGREIVSEGIFHTIWKRQADGSWRYVYD